MGRKNSVLVGCIFYVAIIALGHLTYGSIDALQRIALTKSLISAKSVVTEEFGPIKYGPFQSIIMIPPYFLGYRAGKLLGFEEKKAQHIGDRFYAFLITPLAVSMTCVLYLKILLRFHVDVKKSLLSTFLLAFGTLLLPYSKLMFTEPLNGLLILLSVFFLIKSQKGYHGKHITITFIIVGLLVLNNVIFIAYYFFVFGFLSISMYTARTHDVKKLCLIAFSVCSIVLVCWLLYNFLRYGNSLVFGYKNEGFTNSFFIGLYGLLFSIGKGLVVYSPLTCISLFIIIAKYDTLGKAYRSTVLLALMTCIFYVCLYSKWHALEGGWCWGPRFLVPFIPCIHLAFPLLLTKIGHCNMFTKGSIIAIILFSILINSVEYIGVWQRFQRDMFYSGKNPYWYLVFSPQYSSLFNIWDFKIGVARLCRFFPVCGMTYYLTVKYMAQRISIEENI